MGQVVHEGHQPRANGFGGTLRILERRFIVGTRRVGVGISKLDMRRNGFGSNATEEDDEGR